MLDYYLIGASTILVEEFVLDSDHVAVAINGTQWTDGQWLSSAVLSVHVRGDAHLRSRVVTVDRPQAQAAYRRLGGGDLPDEATQRRVYRVLFAGDLDADGLAALRYRWRMPPSGDPRVPGAARMSRAGDDFTWQLRRISSGVAWCVDLTACLTGDAAGVRPVLLELTAAARGQGLIPVTIERFV